MSDPSALWPAVLARLSERPSMAWLRYLELRRMEGDTAILAPLPGHREVRAIATQARLAPVAAMMGELRGQRTRIELASSEDSQPSRSDGGGASEPSQGGSATGGASSASLNRRAAMQIPLVRQAMEFFPDATLIDARDEAPASKPDDSVPEAGDDRSSNPAEGSHDDGPIEESEEPGLDDG